MRYLRMWWSPLVLGLVLVITWTLIETSGEVFYEQQGELLFIRLLLVIGLFMFSGNSGVLSFGHVAFMAAGAYSSALLTIPPEIKTFTFTSMPHYLSSWIFPIQLGTLTGVLAAAAFAGLLAAIVAFPVVRLAGVAASIATLAVLVMSKVFITQTPALTLGTDVISGVPTTTTLRTTMIWALVILFAANAFTRSRHGLRLRASRENEKAAMAVGVNVHRERYIVFVASGFVFGLAGALYAHFFVGFAYTDFYFELTFLIIAMLVVGGMKSLAGAVVGTYFLSVVYVAMQRVEVNGLSGWHAPSGTANLVLALVLLLSLIVRPAGLTGGREIPWPGGWRRRRPSPDGEPVGAASVRKGSASAG